MMGKCKQGVKCTNQAVRIHAAKNKSQQSRNINKRHKRGKCLKWSNDSMAAAVSEVLAGTMSQILASKVYGIPRCTLHKRVTGKTEQGAKPGHLTKMSFEDEQKLVDYAANRALLGIGFGKSSFLKYAGQLGEKYGLKFVKEVPSEYWWRGIKKRHPQLRQPEGTAAVRHKCMDAVKVARYFQVLKRVVEEHGLNIKAHQIWNMDESGVQLEHKTGKVIARKGTKYLQSSTSGNRETITVFATVNADGMSLPPHFVIKSKNVKSLKSFQTENAPPGSTWSVSDSGWTKQGIAHL